MVRYWWREDSSLTPFVSLEDKTIKFKGGKRDNLWTLTENLSVYTVLDTFTRIPSLSLHTHREGGFRPILQMGKLGLKEFK